MSVFRFKLCALIGWAIIGAAMRAADSPFSWTSDREFNAYGSVVLCVCIVCTGILIVTGPKK